MIRSLISLLKSGTWTRAPDTGCGELGSEVPSGVGRSTIRAAGSGLRNPIPVRDRHLSNHDGECRPEHPCSDTAAPAHAGCRARRVLHRPSARRTPGPAADLYSRRLLGRPTPTGREGGGVPEESLTVPWGRTQVGSPPKIIFSAQRRNPPGPNVPRADIEAQRSEGHEARRRSPERTASTPAGLM